MSSPGDLSLMCVHAQRKKIGINFKSIEKFYRFLDLELRTAREA